MPHVHDFLTVMGRFEHAAQLFQAQYQDLIQSKPEYRYLGSLPVDVVFWRYDLEALDDATAVAHPPDVVRARTAKAAPVMDRVHKRFEGYKEAAVRFANHPGRKRKAATPGDKDPLEQMREAMRALRTIISDLRTVPGTVIAPTAPFRMPMPTTKSVAAARIPRPPITNATATRPPMPTMTSAVASRMPRPVFRIVPSPGAAPKVSRAEATRSTGRGDKLSLLQEFLNAVREFEHAAQQFELLHQAVINTEAMRHCSQIWIDKPWPIEFASWQRDLQNLAAAPRLDASQKSRLPGLMEKIQRTLDDKKSAAVRFLGDVQKKQAQLQKGTDPWATKMSDAIQNWVIKMSEAIKDSSRSIRTLHSHLDVMKAAGAPWPMTMKAVVAQIPMPATAVNGAPTPPIMDMPADRVPTPPIMNTATNPVPTWSTIDAGTNMIPVPRTTAPGNPPSVRSTAANRTPINRGPQALLAEIQNFIEEIQRFAAVDREFRRDQQARITSDDNAFRRPLKTDYAVQAVGWGTALTQAKDRISAGLPPDKATLQFMQNIHTTIKTYTNAVQSFMRALSTSGELMMAQATRANNQSRAMLDAVCALSRVIRTLTVYYKSCG